MAYLKYCLPAVLCFFFFLTAQVQACAVYLLMLIFLNQFNYIWPELSEEELKKHLQFHNNDQKLESGLIMLSALITLGNFWLFYETGQQEFNTFDYCSLIIALAIVNSTFGLTLAHDLLHRNSVLAQKVGSVALFTTGLSYFRHDHFHGHHEHLGTANDPTTAAKNESFYSYLLRVIPFRIRASFTLNNRFNDQDKRKIRRENLIWTAIVVLLVALLFVYSFRVMVLYVVQAMIVYFMFELSNYIQHYGLSRKAGDAIEVGHSWNCYHRYTNYITFFLPVHSPHHVAKEITNIEELKGPRLPDVYFKTMFFALIPSLWFRKMNTLLQEYENHR